MYACLHIPGIGCPGGPEALIALGQMFSPAVELASNNTIVFPIAGLRRLMGGPHQIAAEMARRGQERGVVGNIAIADDPDTAILAAKNRPGVTLIPRGEELKHLGGLRLDILSLSEEAKEVLRRWGIRTLDEFCDLPERGILERLGTEGIALLRLARGAAHRPLKPEQPPPRYEAHFELEYPAGLIEPLLFLLGRFLGELCDRLRSQSLATTEIRLTLDLEDRSSHTRILQLPFATRDARALLKLLQMDLEAHPPAEAVTSLTLHLLPVEPRVVQNDLYMPPTPEPEKLELTLSKIRGLVGEGNVGSPELLNTHRPDAWWIRPTPPGRQTLVAAESSPPANRLGFRYYRPARPARVSLAEGVPHSLWTTGLSGTVCQSAGPWRNSGDWWTSTAWDREEWDIQMDRNSGLYRLYQTAGAWFLEGSYD